jgi:hypothetical protein
MATALFYKESFECLLFLIHHLVIYVLQSVFNKVYGLVQSSSRYVNRDEISPALDSVAIFIKESHG